MRAAACTTVVVCMLHAAALSAQSITTEASATVGHSSEDSDSAAGAQVRAFGALSNGIRFFTEAAWGQTTDADVDAFGSAYPYSNRIKMMEAYAERTFLPRRAVLGVKAGRFRTPFGISSGSDQGYNGFLRPPLMRYDGYFSISNNFLENGVDTLAGVRHFTVESAFGTPGDVGTAIRASGMDTVLRAQTFVGPVIAGVSYIRTLPYQNPLFAHGHAEFGGADVRVALAGVEVRGEFIDGRPFAGTTTVGWYVDTFVHRVGMGPVTLLGRVENLSYQTVSPFDMHAARQTVGARVRVIDGLSVQVNMLHQTGAPAAYGTRAVDFGITYSVRR
jgi:hypothetical protein